VVSERNPATQLLEIFSVWESNIRAGHGGTWARRWESDATEATEEHIRAWRFLGDIARTVEGLSSLGLDMTAAETYLPRWAKMAASVNVSWSQSTGADSAFPQDALSQLQSLATIIELAGARGQPANIELLREVVEQAMQLLAEDSSISGELRAYLVKLVRELRNALEDEAVGGGFNFAEAAERLWVAMQAASAQSKEKGGAWRTVAAKMLPPAAAGVLAHVGNVAFDEVRKALGA